MLSVVIARVAPARESFNAVIMPSQSALVHYGAALLARELRQVVRPQAALAGDARSLPAAERLRSWPGARRGAAGAIGIEHPGFGVSHEVVDIGLIPRIDAGGQTVINAIALLEAGAQIVHCTDGQEGHEEFVLGQATFLAQLDDGRCEIVAWQDIYPVAAKMHFAYGTRFIERTSKADNGLLIVKRPHELLARTGIADAQGGRKCLDSVYELISNRPIDIDNRTCAAFLPLQTKCRA